MATKRKIRKSLIAIGSLVAVGLVANIVLATQANNISASLGTAATSAAAKNYNADDCYVEGYAACSDIEKEGATLLKNKNNCLPLAGGAKVTILGSMSYNYVEGGQGSAGGKDDENTVSLKSAFTEAGLDVNADAWTWLETQCGGSRGVDSKDPAGGNVGWTNYTKIHEFPSATYTAAQSTICKSGYTDYAIVTFARSGAEGASPSMDYDGDKNTLTGTTYLELNSDEKGLLSFCKANFSHTIVLINSATPMELGFIDNDSYNIDACLWIGHPGEAGVVGVGQVLAGKVSPSGHLVDTYGYDMTTNPTYYNTDNNKYANNSQTFYQYEEGIYVGYRYYETADAVGYFDSSAFKAIDFKGQDGTSYTEADKTTHNTVHYQGYDQVVQFPFGYGLSYTDFTQKIVADDVPLEAHGTNTVTVRVTNTGKYAGKGVVQLYAETPYHQDDNLGIKGVGLEKPKVSLCGFAKTDTLEANASQDLKITFKTDDLASFDNFGQGCYALEKGNYVFHVSPNAHGWANEAAYGADFDALTKSLATSYIYNTKVSYGDGKAVGARDSDQIPAVNSMDDVTAGDGSMIINDASYGKGYLSRADFADGIAIIMKHQSNEGSTSVSQSFGPTGPVSTTVKNSLWDASENCSDGVVAALATTGSNTYQYSFKTYRNGVLTDKTITTYAYGNVYHEYAATSYDGSDINDAKYDVSFGKKYYVAQDTSGKAVKDNDGVPVIYDSQPDGGRLLTVSDMSGVFYTTESGKAAWNKLVSMTTLDECVNVQADGGNPTDDVSSIGLTHYSTMDGPGEPGNGSIMGATWFPCAVIIAATWNTERGAQYGKAYAHQDLLAGISRGYAPAMNTHRSPFGGRNFEYYSEDGLAGGEIGGACVKGEQDEGCMVTVKHCALNDNDTNRSGNTTWANEQAIREIYMRPYEISIKKYNALGVMGSLNRIGLSWYHPGLYTSMMRDEWGWMGYLVTDGDGSNGDAYNNTAALLYCAQGAMLGSNGNMSVANASTIAAYGTNYKDTKYGQWLLQKVMLYYTYQYANNDMQAGTPSNTWKVYWYVGDAVLVAGIAAILVVGVIVPLKKKKNPIVK